MDAKTSRKVTCYSGGEQRVMEATQRWRGKLMAPLLGMLAGLKVTPGHLTLLSLLTGLAFCPLFFWWKSLAFAMLALHVLLDGLDGPLARHTEKASNSGSFADTTSDQIVVALSTITLIHSGHIGALPGGLYVFFYTMVVIFAMVRSTLAIPYSWLVRPRFIVYAWFAVEVYLFPGTIDYLLWAFSALLALKMLTGFVRIRKNI